MENMPAAARKKAYPGSAYLAAAQHFAMLAKLFASTTIGEKTPRLTSRQMSASLNAFKKAPPIELAEVSALLAVIVTEIEKIMPNVESDEGGRRNDRE